MKNRIKAKWTEASEALPPEGKPVLMEVPDIYTRHPNYIVGSVDGNGEIYAPFIGWYGLTCDITRWVAIEDLTKEEDK